MRLKCVGGNCDGQVINVHKEYREGDAVRVNLIKEFDFTIEWNPDKIPSHVVLKYAVYIIDRFKWSHGHGDITEIWFLRPENFTTLDAIQFQFNKV